MVKKVLFLLLLVVIFSCQRKKCWNCQVSHVWREFDTLSSKPWFEDVDSFETMICDKTKDEIRAREKEQTFYRRDSVSEVGASLKCK